jgi:putative nucleotidyltransferase with HDIG domain
VVTLNLRAEFPKRVTYRVAQFIRHLHWRGNQETDAALSALLSSTEWELVQKLSPADRRHALSIHSTLTRQGHDDPDLLKAALLHDIGKVDTSGRVTIVHRVTKVLLAVVAPPLLDHLMRDGGGMLRHGLYLAHNHPEIGARKAKDAGASERLCWLIANHHDGTIPDDPQLAALRAIDEKG